MSNAFKNKKSAQSAARKEHGDEYASKVIINEYDGEWFYDLIEAPAAEPEVAVKDPEVDTQEQVLEVEETEEKTAPAANGLGAMVDQMLGNNPLAVPAKSEPKKSESATGLKIEKDRPSQNGVKRPSVGGMCRAVWDACWSHQERTGTAPAAKDVKEMAAAHGWNANNASIEYYQWRKYNGISGRVAAKAEPKKLKTTLVHITNAAGDIQEMQVETSQLESLTANVTFMGGKLEIVVEEQAAPAAE